jgi:hypothetical protein
VNSIIEDNARRLDLMVKRIRDTEARRSETKEAAQAWSAACKEFEALYDQLAFPGGLHNGLERIKKNDVTAAAIALEYLESTPYCFRSQYVATSLRRALNKANLPSKLAQRFEAWHMSKINGKTKIRRHRASKAPVAGL